MVLREFFRTFEAQLSNKTPVIESEAQQSPDNECFHSGFMMVTHTATDLTDEKTQDPEEGFDLDGMLGNLAKWLRILGFDAKFPCKKVAQDRYFVTTNRKLKNPQALEIQDASPIDQIKQLFDLTGIAPNPNLFLSRCLSCNVPVRETAKHKVKGRVPDSVFSRNSTFHECPSCGKLYWEGTHAGRIKRRLEESGVLAKT